jgi:putative ABC transport system permease protein
MFRNYLIMALAVLRRRKFFTVISLFGISFTLTILIVLAAFIDQVAGKTYPDRKRDRSLYLATMEGRVDKPEYHTSTGGSFSYYFLDHFAGGLRMPMAVAISSRSSAVNAYVGNKKLTIDVKYTNAAYWDVLDYVFTEGKPFGRREIEGAEPVAVISEDTKEAYFGDASPVVGKTIEAGNLRYRVIGVVRTVPAFAPQFYSDIYLPYTLSAKDVRDRNYQGEYIGILLARSAGDVPAMKAEYEGMIKRLPVPGKVYDRYYSYADTYMGSLVRTGHEEESGMAYALTAIAVFSLLIMLLPAINLVNINMTRILERSSEIGVRKAFGASSRALVVQFLVENLILTVLGGVIGAVLSFFILRAINGSGLIAHLELELNLTVLSVGLLSCLVFGLVSGVYPAWRMSRLQVVTALKAS